jgi:hypothetical protein
MSRVALQPAGSAGADAHYADTVASPSLLSDMVPSLEASVVDQLQKLYPSGQVPVWGVTPGNKNVNVKKWERLEKGDVTLFARKGFVFASAIVSLKLHNAELARSLWGVDENGETWEYIYFLDEVRGHGIPYEKLNIAAGYSPNNIIQGFNVLDEVKSEAIINAFDLASDTYSPPMSVDDYVATVREIDRDAILDKQSLTKTRTEQAFLRSYLFRGAKLGSCSICNKEYPVYFLVAAHIKKRSECTDEEKRDYQNVVTTMCKFGCDELYEKGYIGVKDGKVIALKNAAEFTDAPQSYLQSITGNTCSSWGNENEKYFTWHNEVFGNL